MMKKFFLLALVCILPLWGIAQNATVDVAPTSNKAAKTVDITTSLAPEAAYVQTVAQQNYFKPVSLPKGNIAYAMSHYGGPALGHVSFDVDNAAGTMATVSSLSITPYGGEFYNEVWYCYTNDNTFYKINYQTGEIMSQISSTNEWVVDMAYDYSTSTMYGTKSGILYSIDLETGACTTIGTLSATLMTLAVDHSGAMYGISITDGNFYSVDKTTAACTLIGATGQGCNYVQSMGFDHNSGVLYWCGYSSAGNFFTIDVATGAATQISAGIGECTSFFVPFVDNPAIASAPTNFTATPQGTDLVCNLSWTNPSTNIGGGTLTGITKMVLKRNGTVIQELTPAGVGATMTYTDSDFPNGAGTYSYSVYAVTSEGNGQSTNASAVIGDMCNVVIEMFDSWGDGWNGAGITVSANGTTYGTASLSSGTTGTATILVPPATIDFTWVAGSWDSECSFNIYDGYSVLLYASAGPGAGTFFSWENTCTAPEAAIINGTVTAVAGGAAIAGATVTYAGTLGGTATTDASGNYSIEVLAGYTYDITVEAAGYNKITETGYTAVAGTTTKNYAMTNPIIGVTPTTVEVTTSYGINGTAELQISNTGNGPLNFGNSIAYTAGKAANEAWDLVASFSATAGGMQGVATDGQYIYLTSWQASPTAGHSFEKYDLDLNFVEGFNISGVSQLRDLTYDGTYFYGGSGSTLYCLDLANQTLVSSVSTGVSTIRHCSYDPENDGFWVGNWSDLYRINRAGVVQVTGPAPESAYGSGYDDITEGGPYLLLFCQPNSNALVYRYNIATNTIESTPIFDFAATPGYNAGISGGAFVGNYDGKICFFGNMQQDPNLIGIYELGLAGWLTMTPGSGTIAAGGTTTATLTMDGWWAQEGTFNATLNVTSSSPNVGSVPVDVTFIIVAPDCDAPTNPAAEVEDFNNIILTWTAPAGNVATYNIYYGNDMTPFATVNGNVTTYTDENLAPGQYCYVIRALYSDGCLSLGTTAVCEIAVEPYGTLTGVVRDAGNNSPISGATVRVGSAANEVTTDASGEYSIDVLTGTYDVRFTAEGYTTYTEEGYVLGIGTHTLNANLEAAGTCDPVGNMTAENTGNNVVHIAWTAPGAGSGEEALLPQYCGEYDNNAIGTGAAADFECMHKWLANAISDYEGWTVTKIAFVPHQTTSAFYIKAYVGTGATPETNILDQSVPTFTAGMWNEIEVETSVVIEEGMNFWAGYRAVPTTGHPAGVDAGPAMAGQGNIMYFSGEWTTLLDLGSTLNYNWCIKVTVQDAKGNVKNLALEPNMPADMGGVLSVTNNPSAKDDVILNETFETGAIPTGWTNTDADGDGYLWDAETGLGLFVGHSGECISSASYINYVGALTPDNWLITPVLDGPGSVNYWVNAQDAAYAYEHYGVYASTSGTNPGDFTLLFEETMTAKGEKYAGLRGGSKEQGAWYERTVENIPSGTKYIAFRHFNCTDAFWLNLDDVTIYGGGGSGSGAGALTGYKIYREGTEIASVGVNILSYDDNFYSDNMDVEYCVTAVYENCESEEACAEVTIIGIENYSNISIYPNPASSTVTIGAENVTSVYVYNNLGQLVSKLGATNSVDVKAYAPGVYYFTINTADGASVNAKIVVTR